MSLQVCPKCNEKAFTWYIDDEESSMTIWDCSACSYHAHENEKLEKECDSCGNKTNSFLKDSVDEFWWCSSCNKVSEKH